MKPHPTSAPVCPPFRPSRSAAALALAAAALLGGCATTGPNANPADPFEDYNRGMSRFNEDVDKALLKPVATAYQDITPRPLRQGVSNALANLGDAWSLVNHLLQLNFTGAYTSAVRLSVNTVLGLGGLLDIATEAGVVRDKQDFGLTLARWGMPSGPYVVLPFFGASTVRDSVGLIADWKLDPTAVDHVRTRNSLYAIWAVDKRANLLAMEAVLEGAALDKYSFTRDAYLQLRAQKAGRDTPLPLTPSAADDEGYEADSKAGQLPPEE